MEGILAKEEEHADELADLLFAVEPKSGEDTRKLYFSDEVPGSSDAGARVKETDRNGNGGGKGKGA
jgi:hypothetical protein